MLPGYICMEKITILWSDCEKLGGGKCPSCPPCSASPNDNMNSGADLGFAEGGANPGNSMSEAVGLGGTPEKL